MSLQPWLQEPWQKLQARRASGQLAHALLLAAPAGLGKRSLAEALQASLLCETVQPDGMACGRCRSCQLRLAGSHADCLRIGLELRDDGKLRSEITVDQIRGLCARFAQTSARGGWRIAIIDPADALNHSAANALLKTLEEPEPGAMMVLVADDPGKLPATIRSRCQRVLITPPGSTEALQWMVAQGVDPADAEFALCLADGNPGEAMELASAESQRLIKAVIDDVVAVLEGRDLVGVAARWNDEHAALRLRTLARLITSGLRAGVGAARSDLARLNGLLGKLDFDKLSRSWDQLNWARSQLDTPVRSDLLILDALGRVRAALV
jgi:DNA polymerase III subunit delta'